MFNHLTLRLKLSLIFLMVAALIGVVGVYEVHVVGGLNEEFRNLVDYDVARNNTLGEIDHTVSQVQSQSLAYVQAVKNAGVHGTLDEQKAALAGVQATVADDIHAYNALLRGNNKGFIPPQTVQALTSSTDALFSATGSYIAAASGKSTVQLEQARVAMQAASDSFHSNLSKLSKLERAHVSSQDASIDAAVLRLIRTILLLVAVVIVVAVTVGVITATLLARSLRKLQAGALRIANGDFSQAVHLRRKDEVGELGKTFNAMSERLRESYQRLDLEIERNKTLLESLGEGVIAIDNKTNIALINAAAQAILDLPPKEKILNLPVNHVLTLYDQNDKVLSASQTPALISIEHTQPISDVYSFHKRSGGKILVHIGASPVLLKGQIAGSIMTIRDVTREKEVDRMKTEFISLASHQLRTPLSAIKWFTEMLVSGDAGELKPDQQEFAQNISESTERMIALVNALLNISRIESGRIMVDPKPTDLGELVRGIVNDLRAKIEERQQNLVVSVHDGLPKINLDPRLIGQVYLNLLTNAIKYTPKGGEISVFISRKDDQIISQITDNGYGIPKDQQGRLFQKFFRASNAVKVETDGTGLGLYLIKAVIESSGGKIWFDSEENKGTTFWFSIPVSGMKPKAGEVTLDV